MATQPPVSRPIAATLKNTPAVQEFARYWWALVLRGVLAIAFALFCFLKPEVTFPVLVLFVGAWFLVDGVFTFIHGFKAEKKWLHFLYGALGVAAGLVTFFHPALTALSLLYLIAFWFILKGVLEISLAIRLRKEIRREWLLGLAGVVSILFGALIILNPGSGALAVLILIGIYALLFGIMMILFGFKVRSLRADDGAPAASTA
jgi:uncharacterized membrane protein HdeD (DUF308 family)